MVGLLLEQLLESIRTEVRQEMQLQQQQSAASQQGPPTSQQHTAQSVSTTLGAGDQDWRHRAVTSAPLSIMSVSGLHC